MQGTKRTTVLKCSKYWTVPYLNRRNMVTYVNMLISYQVSLVELGITCLKGQIEMSRSKESCPSHLLHANE